MDLRLFCKKTELAKLALITTTSTKVWTTSAEKETAIEELAHTEADCWRMEIARPAHHTRLFQVMVTNARATHAKMQTKWWMWTVFAEHAISTTEQTTLEENALTRVQMIHTSTCQMVNARSAQDSTELMLSRETASEINAMIDNTSTTVVSANHAQLAQELS